MGFLLLSGAVSVLASNAATAPALPTVPVTPSYSVTMTAYNAVPAQTSNHPLVTASGAYSNPEVVVARSQDLAQTLPFGTIIAIYGPSQDSNRCGYNAVSKLIGYRVVADAMNVRWKNRIDVLLDTKANYILPNGATENATDILGVCDGTTIQVVGYVDISNPINLPKTQAALAAFVERNGGIALNQ